MKLGQDELDQLEVLARSRGWQLIWGRMSEIVAKYQRNLEDDQNVLHSPGVLGELRGGIRATRLCRNLPAILMDEARQGVAAEAKAERKR